MKRTIPTDRTAFMIMASELVSRMSLFGRIGTQYDGARDLYQALGYPAADTLKWTDFFGRYTRQDIARAIIDRPVSTTWKGNLEIIESNESEDTELEKAWIELDKKLQIKSKLVRLDKLTGIGRYGVLLLGLSDVKDLTALKTPAKKSQGLTLEFISPFGENSASISAYEDNPKSKRFGKPLIYKITMVNPTTVTTSEVDIHYSRVLHIVDAALESEVFGTPRLEPVYNRLMDIEKLVGGDAEMFWRGARPGYTGSLKEGYSMPKGVEDTLITQLDEFEHNLRRFLTLEGVDIKAFEQQIADPKNHLDILIQMVSAETGIPKRILTGSERGELSSAQDSTEWKDYIQARRLDFAEPTIVRPLVDKLMELGILPEPKQDYFVKWSDLYSQSEKDQVELGKGRANALREYTYNPIAEAILPPEAFLEFCLGLSGEQITLIRKMRDDMISSEQLSQTVLDTIDAMTTPKAIPAGTPIPQKTTPMKRTK